MTAKYTLALAALMAIPAHASQYGLAATAGSGKGDITGFDVDYDSFGADFLFGTGRNSRLLIYRLTLGYVSGEISGPAGSVDTVGFATSNTLGFKVLNQPRGTRVWIGATGYIDGVRVTIPGRGSLRETTQNRRLYGIGPSLGVDVDVPGGPSLAFTLGYRVGGIEDINAYGEPGDARVDIHDLVFKAGALWGDGSRAEYRAQESAQTYAAPSPVIPQSREQRLQQIEEEFFAGRISNQEYDRQRREALASP